MNVLDLPWAWPYLPSPWDFDRELYEVELLKILDKNADNYAIIQPV